MPLPLQPKSSKPESKTRKHQSRRTGSSGQNSPNKRDEYQQAKTSPVLFQETVKTRSAFEDLTNASESKPAKSEKKTNKEMVKNVSKETNRNKHILEPARTNESKRKMYNLEMSSLETSAIMEPNSGKPLILGKPTNTRTPTTENASVLKPMVLKEEPTTKESTLTKKSLKKSRIHGIMSPLEKSLPMHEQTNDDDDDDDFVLQPLTSAKKHKPKETTITKKTLSVKKMSTYKKDMPVWEELPQENDKDPFIMEIANNEKKPNAENSSSSEESSLEDEENPIRNMRICYVSPPVIPPKVREREILRKRALIFNQTTFTGEESFGWKTYLSEEMRATKRKVPLPVKKNTDFEESTHLKEPSTSKKGPTTEETSYTGPFSLKNKCSTQESKCTTQIQTRHYKPLVLQTDTSEEKSEKTKSLSFIMSSTTEENSFFQLPSTFQEKPTTQREVGFSKKSQAFQENVNSEDNSFMEQDSHKKKHATIEANNMKKQSHLGKNSNPQGKISNLKSVNVLQLVAAEEKSLTKETLPSKKSTSGKDSPFQGPSSLQEKGTTLYEMSTLKKPFISQKTPTKKSFFEEAVAFQKQRTIEEANTTKKPLPLTKHQHTAQGSGSRLKKPLVFQTSGEKSHIKESLSFKEEDEPVQKKKCTTQTLPPQKKLSEWQKIFGLYEDDIFTEEPVSLEELTTEDVVLVHMPSSSNRKRIARRKRSLFNKPLVIKTITKEESLSRKLLPFRKKENHTNVSPSSEKPLTILEEITSEEEKIAKKEEAAKAGAAAEVAAEAATIAAAMEAATKAGAAAEIEAAAAAEAVAPAEAVVAAAAYRKEPEMKSVIFCQEPFSLHNKHTNKNKSPLLKALGLQETDNKEDSSKEMFSSHEDITGDELFITQPLAFQDYPSIEKEVPLKETLQKENPSTGESIVHKQPLILQKNSTSKEAVCKEHTTSTEAHVKETSILQEKPGIKKESILKEPLTLQEKLSPEMQATQKEPTAVQEKPSIEKEVSIKESLAMQDKPSIEETILKDPLVFQEKSNIEQEALLQEPLTLQDKSPDSAFLFDDIFALQKKSTEEEPLTMEEYLTHKDDSFTKSFLSFDFEKISHVSSETFESTAGQSSTANTSCEGKSSSSCSKNPSSPLSRSTQMETSLMEDIDQNDRDPLLSSVYAKDIFIYLKEREKTFTLEKYMDIQDDINSDMRAILVDWLVEVQIIFEMSHETLYLAVKLMDHYLMNVACKKDKLQLLGSTAFLIAAKFEEPNAPCVDDFLYICDDVYQRDEFISMEVSILQNLKFEVSIPVAYNFLRRYAKCVRANMKTLTLSRFICEMTLLEYDFVQERASKLAAASFLLALYMKNLGKWAPVLEYYSGYRTCELYNLVIRLNSMLTFHLQSSLKTIQSKYSHQLFFEVSKIPPLDIMKLENILNVQLCG